MRVLLIHTSGAEGSVALADTELAEAVVGQEVLPGKSSSERLVAAVRGLLGARGWRVGGVGGGCVWGGGGGVGGVGGGFVVGGGGGFFLGGGGGVFGARPRG